MQHKQAKHSSKIGLANKCTGNQMNTLVNKIVSRLVNDWISKWKNWKQTEKQVETNKLIIDLKNICICKEK